MFSENNVYALESKTDKIVQKHESLFTGLGKLKDFKATLHIDQNVTPRAQPIRRSPFHLRHKIEQEIERLLQLDVIERVEGPTPWLTPIVAVPKADGSVRLCLDMRIPNTAIIKQKYPFPLVDELVQELEGAKIVSELDFNMGYYQIELDEDSRPITTFATDTGVYRFKRLNFGTTTAGDIFQQAVQGVLKTCEGVKNMSDNIIVFGKDANQHDERLDAVLSKLKEHGFTLNIKKCKFGVSSLDFMGYMINEKGVSLGKEKIDAVVNAREPQNASEMRSFLGLVNFCAKFIPNVTQLTAPLREIICKSCSWDFNDHRRAAFQKVKDAVAETVSLCFFKTNREIELIVDAGPEGLGAVLTQKQKDGNFGPVAFASRALTTQEKCYSQTEKEALAVLWACEKFHLYLYGTEFAVVTDHKPLEVIYSPNSRSSARIERWTLRLQQYKYTIRYEKGVTNIADPLSRLLEIPKGISKPELKLQKVTESYIHFITESAVPKTVTIEELKTATAADQDILLVKQALQDGSWHKTTDVYRRLCNELTWHDGLLVRGRQIVVPKRLRERVLAVAHDAHMGIEKTKATLRTKVWWPGMDTEAENKVQNCIACQMQGQPERPEPLKMTNWVKDPWDMLAIDVCGPFNTGEYLVVLTDYVSKWPEATIMKSVTSASIIKWLEHVFACHGYPRSITSDNGAPFVSREFHQYLKSCGIESRHVTPYWPQANGQVERMNKVFLKSFRAAVAEGRDWRNCLTDFLRVYRTTAHSSTKVSPAEQIFRRPIRTKLPSVQDNEVDDLIRKAQKADHDRKEKEKAYADHKRNAKISDVREQDYVLIQQRPAHKLKTNFQETPYKVVRKTGNNLLLEHPDKRRIKRNVSQVKKLHTQHVYTDKNTMQDLDDEFDDTEVDLRSLKTGCNKKPTTSVRDSSEGTSSSNNRTENTRRTNRTIRIPAYYKDFVM